MKYAINEVTGKLESADQTRGLGRYICPVCTAVVNFRAGAFRRAHFAHWPGWGSPECENFVLGQYGVQPQGKAVAVADRRKMELRLWIPRGPDRAAWQLELILPTARECQATVTVDVGGRFQTLSMRGMAQRRRIGAEPSVKAYRIVDFEGKPDPAFLNGVERECSGLPAIGAAAFSASGAGELKGFPRSNVLRGGETFALLWRVPETPDFPDELEIEKLRGRQEWNLALVGIPEEPTESCIAWLESFTGLRMAPPVPSILPVWPFLTRHASVNCIDCVRSERILLSVARMPVGRGGRGPAMQAQSGAMKLGAVGVERSPALFTLRPEGADFVRVTEATAPDSEAFFSFSLGVDHTAPPLTVELAFRAVQGDRQVVALHGARSAGVTEEFRRMGISPEYLSMPAGAKGTLRIEGRDGSSTVALRSGSDAAPHDHRVCLAQPDALAALRAALVDFACQVELDFGGFGRMRLARIAEVAATRGAPRYLPPLLRARIGAFLTQLQSPTSLADGDVPLIRAMTTARRRQALPPSLIPHYRSLVKALRASGVELERLEEGVEV
ncbi:hypothetical protein K7G19_02030 [Cupriavidus sp. DB3]|uniref:competence protein CoiA family protein n=1 Tax=Cupriavidus sp. DB3 TaxID=2873259 RepID=UPI001CF28DBA|nr:hypothetical protein [Cupriavidus sp. DB3]MCA7082376.1 hypothetical protein [Cupriavidus sp. DB3]